MMNYRAKAAIFRENAEEIRIRTEALKRPEAKKVFLRLADDYDKMAETYDAIAGTGGSRV